MKVDTVKHSRNHNHTGKPHSQEGLLMDTEQLEIDKARLGNKTEIILSIMQIP